MTTQAEMLRASLAYIRQHTTLRPTIGLVLGSGLGDFAEDLGMRTILSTSEIPHYPVSTVVGHKGKLVIGELHGKPILAFQGRTHFYESRDLETVLYPIRVAHGLGIETLIVTNAAGGVNRSFTPADLMLVTDQINLTFEAPSFMTPPHHAPVYDTGLMKITQRVAASLGIALKQGVYAGMKGPSYETAAEVEMIHRIGGDAVGMSTVFETGLGAALGMKILGLSCITNYGTGISNQKLSHGEVTEVGNQVKQKFSDLLSSVIKEL